MPFFKTISSLTNGVMSRGFDDTTAFSSTISSANSKPLPESLMEAIHSAPMDLSNGSLDSIATEIRGAAIAALSLAGGNESLRAEYKNAILRDITEKLPGTEHDLGTLRFLFSQLEQLWEVETQWIPSQTWSTGIGKIKPRKTCPGKTVGIYPDRSVLPDGFPERGITQIIFPTMVSEAIGIYGYSYSQIISWSPEEIFVKVPKGVVPGCIGFFNPGNDLPFSLIPHPDGPRPPSPLSKRLNQYPNPPPAIPGPVSTTAEPSFPVNYFAGVDVRIDEFSVSASEPDGGWGPASKAVRVKMNTQSVLIKYNVAGETATIEDLTPGARGPELPATYQSIKDPRSGSFVIDISQPNYPATLVYRLTVDGDCGTKSKMVRVFIYGVADIKVEGFEITQATQHYKTHEHLYYTHYQHGRKNWMEDNSIPLIANKRTLVRVYVEFGPENFAMYPGASTGYLFGLTGELHYSYTDSKGKSRSATISPLMPTEIMASDSYHDVRGDLKHTVNFEIPRDHMTMGFHSAKVTLANPFQDSETVELSESSELEASQHFMVWRQRVQNILYIPIKFRGPGHQGLGYPTLYDFWNTAQGALNQLPLSNLRVFMGPKLTTSQNLNNHEGYNWTYKGAWNWMLAWQIYWEQAPYDLEEDTVVIGLLNHEDRDHQGGGGLMGLAMPTGCGDMEGYMVSWSAKHVYAVKGSSAQHYLDNDPYKGTGSETTPAQARKLSARSFVSRFKYDVTIFRSSFSHEFMHCHGYQHSLGRSEYGNKIMDGHEDSGASKVFGELVGLGPYGGPDYHVHSPIKGREKGNIGEYGAKWKSADDVAVHRKNGRAGVDDLPWESVPVVDEDGTSVSRLMTYDPPPEWVGEQEYKTLYWDGDVGSHLPGASFMPSRMSPTFKIARYQSICIRGKLHRDNRVEIADSFSLPTTMKPTYPMREDTRVWAEMRDESGSALASVSLGLDHGYERMSDFRPFFIRARFPKEATSIVFLKDGEVIHTEELNPDDAPSIENIQASFTRGKKSCKLKWEYGNDSKASHCLVRYSNDNGHTWRPVGQDIKGRQLSVNMDSLPGGKECLFQVVATKHLATSTETTESFSVKSRPPTIELIKPQEGLDCVRVNAVSERGEVLDGDSVVWKGGARYRTILGTGRELVLPPGRHRIGVYVQDENGKRSSKRVTVTVEI
jgi:hypothetical protein